VNRWHKFGQRRTGNTTKVYWRCSARGPDGDLCSATAVETLRNGSRQSIEYRQHGNTYSTPKELEHVHRDVKRPRIEPTVTDELRRLAAERPDRSGGELVRSEENDEM
jgi:hypothetical protein